MFELFREASRWVHIVVGFTGLAAFWIPIFARKGGVNHVRFGRVFAWSAYIVTVTAMFSTTLIAAHELRGGVALAEDAQGYGFLLFLFYLGLVTFASARHAVRTIKTRREPSRIATPLHRTLAGASIASSAAVIVFALALRPANMIVLLALSPVGFLVGRGMLSYMRDPERTKRAWFYEHMGAMIGAGVAFHTAFLVFGGVRLFDLRFDGPLGVIPWIAPAAIGIPGSIVWERYYRRKFKEPRASFPATAA